MAKKGEKLSEEHKRKIAEALKGRKLSEEHKKNVSKTWFKKGHKSWNKGKKFPEYSGENSPMWGRKHTEEAKRAVSEANKGRKLTDEHKEKIGNFFKGRKLSKEHRKKIGESQKGKIISEETKEKISNKLKGRKTGPFTKEHKENMGLSKVGDKNPQWKGDNVGYEALHAWVRRRKSTPTFCEDCKKVPPYDLANISQEYKRDLSDWEWLCRCCHMKKDGRLKKLHESRRRN